MAKFPAIRQDSRLMSLTTPTTLDSGLMRREIECSITLHEKEENVCVYVRIRAEESETYFLLVKIC